MSMWAKVGVKIQDAICFRGVCEKNGLDYRERGRDSNQQFNGMRVFADITTKDGRGQAYLCEQKDGGYALAMDSDSYYNSIAEKFGPKADRLFRDYTQEMVVGGIRKKGGMINYQTEQPDGSLVIRATVF